MKLALYNRKRNFKKTPEPKGKISHTYKFLYVIQKHAASHLHYDFRLELNGVLLSWAVPKGPSLDPSVKRLAMHVEDHPVEYGHFEGIIPQGEYGGGTVMLWDEGVWVPRDENPTAAYLKGHLKFILKGKKLKGEWNLIQFKREDKKSWFLIKAKDEYAQASEKYNITEEEPNSVLTGYDLDEIQENYSHIWSAKSGLKAAKNRKTKKYQNALKSIKINLNEAKYPKKIFPQLATLVDEPPSGNEWLHEIKFDGYRIISLKENDKIKLMSRNNKDWTDQFKNVAKELKKIPIKKLVLDGELVLLDEDQKSNFQLLQNAVGGNYPFKYYIFDILYYDKYNLMSLPLIERKNILKEVLASIDTDILLYSDHIIGSGSKVFSNACEMGLEGVVSKNINSSYAEKRTKTWLKLKCIHRQEFVVGGYSPPKRSRNYFGSLYLGYYDENGYLKYCGNVGTGFNQKSLKTIYESLKKLISNKNPFTTKPPGITTAIWVKPKLVAEVEFSEWTSGGTLRHPSFKGLRTDKPANKITKENRTKLTKIKSISKPKTELDLPFKLTNPNKILYPEAKIKKIDIAHYFDQIQEWILPYIANRPLTLVRCPDGYKECFYQKHINKSSPKNLFGIKIKEKEKIESCIYIKDRAGLMSLVQMGTLEIHPWGSRIETVEYPDIITIDLDPAPDVSWKQVVLTAKRVRKHLLDFHLKSFVKTTGGKGLHVVIPILPEYDWKQVKNFAHVFVKFMVTQYPTEYVSEMSKIKRKGKIFVDYLRNQRGATAIAAYSTRARLDAPVSVPLDWDELTNNIKDNSFDIFSLPKRLETLKKDPWLEFFKMKQSLRLDEI